MSGPLVERANVEAALLRPLTSNEALYIYDLCDQVSSLLRTRIPTIDTRVALASTDPRWIDPNAVAAMLAGVIKRYLVNPSGATSLSLTRGPFSETTGFGARTGGVGAIGDLSVTDSDVAKIDPAVPATAATIFASPRRVC